MQVQMLLLVLWYAYAEATLAAINRRYSRNVTSPILLNSVRPQQYRYRPEQVPIAD